MVTQHESPVLTQTGRGPKHVVVIAASAGGVQTASLLLAALPVTFPAAVILVLHLSPEKKSRMVEILERQCLLPVQNADDHDAIHQGVIYVARPDWHLTMNTDWTLSL